MSRTNDYYVLASMPKAIYDSIADVDNVQALSVYDRAMYNHYKDNEEWQQADKLAKEAREAKKAIEFQIRKDVK